VNASTLKEVRKMALESQCVFGTNLHFERVKETLTRYGHTARFGNLELHIGNFQYDMRADTKRVFVFDRDDYRFIHLRKNIGVYEVSHVTGCLLGCLIGTEGDLIRFRIDEKKPSHLLMCCMDVEGVKEKAINAEPDAIADFMRNEFVVAYSLGRPKSTPNDRGAECEDHYYDNDPDEPDVYDGKYDFEMSEKHLIEHRLEISGF
jgi:hypothetical protein